MITKPTKYAVYDAYTGEYLASFVKPVKGVDAAVTKWTWDTRAAMWVTTLANARSIAQWLNGTGSGCVVLNARGERVYE